MRWSVSPTRVPDWNWNWTAVRPERYIFLNILVTVRDRLVTQPCHLPATTHYVPTTLPGYVAGHGRAVPTLYVSPIYTRDFLTSSFPFSFIYIYILALGRRIFPAFPFHAEEAFRFSSPEEKALVLWDNCENSWWRRRGRERLDRRGDRDKHSDPDSR